MASGAALLPSLDSTTTATRGRSDLAAPASTTSSVGLQAGWELDLFGANRAGVNAARLRTAIQEVEGALVTLENTAQRGESAKVATDGFQRSYRATAASYDAGAASLFDLEDARRSLVSAQSALIELRRERLVAWIALYRSMGGGWSPTPLKQLASQKTHAIESISTTTTRVDAFAASADSRD